MTEHQWNEFLKRSKGWFIRMSFELLHSEAYKKVNYGPALKVLNWFHEKIQVERIKSKRGKDRFQMVNNGDISFTYREAALRGLTSQKFNKALKELHGMGFIDIQKPGSALKGDFTRFALSDRWKTYGASDFKQMEFPKSIHWVNFGFGAKQKHSRKS